jgi:hypothetical protein
MKYLRLDPEGAQALLDSMESNDHCSAAYQAQIAELREKIKQFVRGGGLTLHRDPAHGEPRELAMLPVEVRQLVHAVDHMRDHWAEASEERRAELWRKVHEANDRVWNR